MPRLLQELGKAECQGRLLPCLKFLWGSGMPGWVVRPQDIYPLILLLTRRRLAHRASVHSFCHPPTQVSIHTPLRSPVHPYITPSHIYTHSHQHLLTHPYLQVSTHQSVRLFLCLCSLFCHPHIPVSTGLCPVPMCDPVPTTK